MSHNILTDNQTQYLAGNRCGHDRGFLRDITFPKEQNRPKVIQWCMQRTRKYFNNPEKYFNELKGLNKPLKNKTDHRLNRSDGRESLMQMSLLLFYNLELSSMTVRLDDIVFNSPTFEDLTNNGDYLSLSRARRALNKLVRSGYVVVTRQFEKAKNLYHALASIKEITPKFFIALGLGKYYSFSQSYKRKIFEKRQHRYSKKTNTMQRFDKYLPQREVVFKKVSQKEDIVQVITSEDINCMRKELVTLQWEKASSIQTSLNIEHLIQAAKRYSYDVLKKTLDHYRTWKNEKSP